MSIRPLPFHRHPVCPRCRYDLYGSVHADRTICPECGYVFDAHALPRAPRADDWRVQDGLVRVLALCLLRGVLLLPLWVGAVLVALWAHPHLQGRARGWAFLLVLIMGGVTYVWIVRNLSDAAGAVSWLFTLEAAVILTAFIWVSAIIAVALMQSAHNPHAMVLLTGAGPVIVGLTYERLIEE